jgi:hypothetical protein
VPHVLNMYITWLHYLNNGWRRVQTTKILHVYILQPCVFFIYLTFLYLSQNTNLTPSICVTLLATIFWMKNNRQNWMYMNLILQFFWGWGWGWDDIWKDKIFQSVRTVDNRCTIIWGVSIEVDKGPWSYVKCECSTRRELLETAKPSIPPLKQSLQSLGYGLDDRGNLSSILGGGKRLSSYPKWPYRLWAHPPF